MKKDRRTKLSSNSIEYAINMIKENSNIDQFNRIFKENSKLIYSVEKGTSFLDGTYPKRKISSKVNEEYDTFDLEKAVMLAYCKMYGFTYEDITNYIENNTFEEVGKRKDIRIKNKKIQKDADLLVEALWTEKEPNSIPLLIHPNADLEKSTSSMYIYNDKSVLSQFKLPEVSFHFEGISDLEAAIRDYFLDLDKSNQILNSASNLPFINIDSKGEYVMKFSCSNGKPKMTDSVYFDSKNQNYKQASNDLRLSLLLQQALSDGSLTVGFLVDSIIKEYTIESAYNNLELIFVKDIISKEKIFTTRPGTTKFMTKKIYNSIVADYLFVNELSDEGSIYHSIERRTKLYIQLKEQQ